MGEDAGWGRSGTERWVNWSLPSGTPSVSSLLEGSPQAPPTPQVVQQLQSPPPTPVSLLSSRPRGPHPACVPRDLTRHFKTNLSLPPSPTPSLPQPPPTPSGSVTKPGRTLLLTRAPAQPSPPAPKPLGRSRLFFACPSPAPASLPPFCPPKPLIRPHLPHQHPSPVTSFSRIPSGPRSEWGPHRKARGQTWGWWGRGGGSGGVRGHSLFGSRDLGGVL